MNDFALLRPRRTLLLAIAIAVAFAATSASAAIARNNNNKKRKSYDTIQGRSCLRSMSGMMKSMSDLADEYPHLVTISDIGDSYLKNNAGRKNGRYDIPEGGYDIHAVRVTAPNDRGNDNGNGNGNGKSSRKKGEKGKMLLTSGVHAREWAPPELLGRFVELLVRGYDSDAELTWILEHVEIHAILYVNPDGRYIAEKYPELYWRKNLNPDGGCGDDEYGVDINRNFDFMWGERSGASHVPCDSDYHGTKAESEPETTAVAEYARELFPRGQRKDNPEKDMGKAFGEDNTGMYIDIHSSGGYVYYPWGHRDAQSPDDEALQALGRKINSFNDYKLWAGGQPDFVYEASGDTSDYMYAALGVSSLGFEIGDDFYQDCETFEDEVAPINLPALVYAAKVAHRPFKEVKGPDVMGLDAEYSDGKIVVTASARDGRMVNSIVNSIRGFDPFRTGDQLIEEVRLYLDVHPDNYQSSDDAAWSMRPTRRRLDLEDTEPKRVRVRNVNCSAITRKKQCKRSGGCEWFTRTKICSSKGDSGATGSTGNGTGSRPPSSADDPPVSPEGTAGGSSSEENSVVAGFESGEESVELTIDASKLSTGRHAIFVQATDIKGYKGPVSSVYVEVSRRQRESSLRGEGSP